MDQVRFGSLLREARERKGLDLSAVSSRLRIRSDILKAIENSDLSHMPPKGYARNMVNAYARFLGLNSTEITSLYLDEVYAYQVSQARMSNHPGNTLDFQQGLTRQGASSMDQRGRSSSAPGRTLYIDDRRSNRRGSENSSTTRGYSENRTHRSNRTAVPQAQYTNFYSGPHASHMPGSKLPFIIAAVIILILLLIVIVLLVRGGSSDSTEDVANIPVTGLTDPINDESTSTSDDDSMDDTTTTASVAPTSAIFTFSVEDGDEAWVQLYINDSTELAQTLTGPYEQSYEVTGTLRLVTPRPAVVTCTLDGEELDFTLVSGSSVNYEVTVDFSEILAAWEEENGVSSSDSTSDDTTDDTTTSS